MDDRIFSDSSEYSYANLIYNIQLVNSDIENIKPFHFLSFLYDITKAFKMISSALSLAFDDITTKVNIWRDLFKTHYKDAKSLQDIMNKEIELKICELNGENNKPTFDLYKPKNQ